MKIKHNVLIKVDNSDIVDGTFEIPAGVKSIGNGAFYDCSNLISIKIPASVTSIGDAVFADCSDLMSVTFAENSKLTSIGEYAFNNCSKLTKVTFAENNQLKSIGNGTFSYCYNLTSVTIPSSVEEIGLSAFFDCGKLKSPVNNYKAFLLKNGKLFAIQNDKEYQLGHKSIARGELKPCKNGLHYCTNIFDIFNYYYGTYGKDFVITICDVSEENVGHDEDSKRCARWIIPQRILTREEVIRIMNGGEKNNDIT